MKEISARMSETFFFSRSKIITPDIVYPPDEIWSSRTVFSVSGKWPTKILIKIVLYCLYILVDEEKKTREDDEKPRPYLVKLHIMRVHIAFLTIHCIAGPRRNACEDFLTCAY